MTKQKFTIYLERASVLYLALPLLIFFIGMLHWLWGIATAASLVAAVWFYIKKSGYAAVGGDDSPANPGSRRNKGRNRSKRGGRAPEDNSIPSKTTIPPGPVLLCLLSAILVTGLFGAGGWGHQTWDWHKHNAMLSHLTLQNWPVLIQASEGKFILVYYIAYYLPAALVGKGLGFFAANQALFLYTAIGVFFSMLWLFVFSRTTALWIILLFFFFSGLDIIGAFVGPDAHRVSFFNHLEWWNLDQLTAPLVGIAWLPQHVIPSWLLTGLAIKNIACKQSVRRGLLLVTLGVLWSAFSALGIAAFIALYSVWRCRPQFRSALSLENLLSLLPLLCICAYLLAGSGSGGALAIKSSAKFFAGYPLFLCLDFLLFWGMLLIADGYLQRKSQSLLSDDLRQILYLSLILVSAFFWSDDFNLQKNASHPFVFVLLLATVRMLESADHIRSYEAFRNMVRCLVLLLLLGAWTPIVEVNVAFENIRKRGEIYKRIAPTYIVGNKDIHGALYVGSLDSHFYRFFARR